MAKKKKKRRIVKKKARRKRSTRTALAKLSMGQLQAEMDRRASAVARLETRRAKLLGELADIDYQIGQAGGASGGKTRVASVTRRGTARKRPRNTSNLVDALRKTLKGRTLSVTDVADAVQKGGYKTTSENFRTIVNQTLISNKKVFRKVSRGKYTAK